MPGSLGSTGSSRPSNAAAPAEQVAMGREPDKSGRHPVLGYPISEVLSVAGSVGDTPMTAG